MRVGDVIAARFEIVAAGGAGAHGSIYRARDREAGEDVALKVVGDARDHRRFVREAQVLRALDHPAIVRYVAHGDIESDGAFLAMEWIEGEDLAARIARGPLGVAQSIALVTRIAAALEALHAHGV